MARHKVYSYVELDERTSIQKLGVFDQVRAMIRQVFHDDSKELLQTDLLTKEQLKLQADLMNFIERATDPIRRGNKRSVEMKISSKFKSVIDEVLTNPRLTNYYLINYKVPDIPYDIEFSIVVRMEVLR